ncbi:hypothetical protein SAMN03159443_00449 [Pseudomonas sp. NFACC15-1]|uniref:hypothetical protein n=1 Tax=unclassified Pseudomonas TaxID=196821 RepID=UPI0008848C6E|nr:MULTISPECIES: hypothetical protein [unclassified Pseudomonas]SDA41400.1 hypothetical protein SAMN03159443_00449 [Pseudomonas sp. NFACC15-1]SDW39058.1 hypothetical protein SAMN03159380_00618 [Pseudomonas sp. NFACC14]
MQITGGAGIPAAARNDVVSVSNTSAGPLEKLDPAMLNVTGFQPSELGSPRQVKAAFELLSRATEPFFQECNENLGQLDVDAKKRIEHFIESGEMPADPENSGIFNLIGEGGTTGAESRVDRLKEVLEAGMELLEAAKGPGLNLLNVAGHTGLIIALATCLRQYVGYHVEHALREGDTPEATRAWATVALAMMGPALTLMGAVRREMAGEATWKSRLGNLCIASAALGGSVAAVLTGAASKLFPTLTGGVVYIMARAVAQSFFPLKDNAGPANAASTAVTAAAYGAGQFALAELGKVMPLSGPARAAGELGHDFGADAIQAGLNALGMVADVATLIVCKSWHVLSPQRGLDSVFSDPESLRQVDLEVRAGVQWPTRTQLADAFVNVAGVRLSFGHTLTLFLGAIAAILSESQFGDDTQGRMLNGCFAIMMTVLYFPLIFANLKQTGNTYTLQETTTS